MTESTNALRPDLPPPHPDVAAALTELVAVLVSTASVEHLLDDAARLAARAMGADVVCGITLQRNHGPATVAASGPLAGQADEIQYGQDDGPCLQAMRTGEPVEVPDMVGEQRWGRYAGHALACGVRSSLSLPLAVDEESRGALNLYATTPHAFAQAERVRAAQFAEQVTGALTLVIRHARQVELSEQLREALASRSVIDQAIGIVMDQQRCTAVAAFDLLRAASQNRNRKLREVAADIVRAVGGDEPQPGPFHDPG